MVRAVVFTLVLAGTPALAAPPQSGMWERAVALMRAHRHLEALPLLRAYVEDPKADRARKQIAERDLIPRAYAATAHIRIDPLVPEGTMASIDGVPMDDLTREVDKEPGLHVVTFKLGEQTENRKVPVNAGEEVVVGTSLKPRAIEPPTAAASSSGPVHEERAAPPPAVAQDTSSSGRGLAVLGLAGLSLVSIGTGVVFTLFARSSDANAEEASKKAKEARIACPNPRSQTCTEVADHTAAASANRGFATGFFIAGGALAVGALVALFLWPKDKSPAIVPVVGPQQAGLQWVGRF
jgi:hypothetical protein